MDTKPVVTYYAKNTNLPDKLKDKITTNLPEECIEWQRSYGRSTKKVYLEVNFVPFRDAALKENFTNEGGGGGGGNKHNLLGRCLLHTYWFECSDIDMYKSQIREDVISWMNRLRENEILDWLIVVVDSSEKKKSNKTKLLPRSTVADKVKSDFPSSIKDASDRCVSLINPMRNETSAGDSYEFFLDRLRLVLLKSYSKHLTRYEDYVRSQRERRNSKSWDFFSFFILQEEMAFAFEMLSLYEDALIQYDELDALFSQFVINSHVIQPPDWLKVLIERCHSWAGLTLSKTISTQLREKIRNSTASLLDLRNYLFSRQCELLLMQHKPWELSTRALPFLHNCVNELNILEINLPQGAVACWVFLSALEILQKCERYNDSSQMQIYSRYTIGLWAYARRKLEELGTLCGLMPGMNHDSECIHKVVSLISGMGNDPYSDENLTNQSPQSMLKEALSKPDAFSKAYLEVSELNISTYKHIGRFRSGRLVGRELAFLYMKMDKHQQSIPFLLDLEKVFAEDRWKMLLFDTRKNILDCFLVLNETAKILQYALLLASSSVLEIDERVKYLTIAKEKFSSLTHSDMLTVISMEEILPIRSISIKSEGVFVTNSQLELSLTLESNLLETMSFASIQVYLSYEPFSPRSRVRSQDKQVSAKNSLLCSHPFSSTLTHQNNRKINFRTQPKFETYHDTSSVGSEVGIRCPNLNQVFKRLSVESTNSGPSLTMETKSCSGDDDGSGGGGGGGGTSSKSEHFFHSNNININPGINNCNLTFEPLDSGCYTIERIKCLWKMNEKTITFTHSPLPVHLCFTVISEEPSLKLIGKDGSDNISTTGLEILSGPPQTIILRLNSGSYCFQPGSIITLKSSTELFMKLSSPSTSLSSSSSSNIKTAATVETTNGDGGGGDNGNLINGENCDIKSTVSKPINYSPLEMMNNHETWSELTKDYSNLIEINFTSTLEPFQNYDIPLTIVSKFAHQRGPSGTEHNIILSYPDAKSQAIKSISRILYLTPPFMSTIKLHLLRERTFIEIIVRSVSHQRFELFNGNLIANGTEKDHDPNDFIFKSFNSPRKMIIYKDQMVHYVWEIFSTDINSLTKLLFTLKYNPITDEQTLSSNPLAYHSYDCDFSIKSIKSTAD